MIFLIKRAIFIILLIYAFFFINNQIGIYRSNIITFKNKNIENNFLNIRVPYNRNKSNEKELINVDIHNLEENYKLSFIYKGQKIFIDNILLNEEYGSFKERTNFKVSKGGKKKIILSRIGYINNDHLGGCHDWNCEIISNSENNDNIDGVLVSSLFDISQFNDNILIGLLTQESPAYDTTGSSSNVHSYPHTFISFRHDSYTSSPYGYTVHLAPESQLLKNPISEKDLVNKSKAISWMVSHCDTASKREEYVNYLKKYIDIDIYGGCGNKLCRKENNCNDVDNEYYFYLAFENSVCKDYITEKMWYRGYNRPIIPIVLKRSIVEKYAPPNSFIAVDDFKNTQELANFLKDLMNDKKKYISYFDWMKEYKVIFLDGLNHDIAERPWGFCQFCRMLHSRDKNFTRMTKFKEWWNESCEDKGTLVKKHIN